MAEPLVTSTRLELFGTHAHIAVWVRGCKSGDLIVDVTDAYRIEAMLNPVEVSRRGPCQRCDGPIDYRDRSTWDIFPGRPIRLLCDPCADAVCDEWNRQEEARIAEATGG